MKKVRKTTFNDINLSTKKGRKHTKTEVQRILADIHTLMQQNKSDSEIRALLGLEIRTYQRFAARIHNENKKIWYDIVREELYTEFLKLRSSLEETYAIALSLAKNPDYKDILEALHVKDQARINIISLLTQGPELVREVQKYQYYQPLPKEQDVLIVKQHHP